MYDVTVAMAAMRRLAPTKLVGHGVLTHDLKGVRSMSTITCNIHECNLQVHVQIRLSARALRDCCVAGR